MEILQAIQKDLLTSTHGIFGFEHLYTFHFCTSNLLNGFTYTKLRFDAICTYPGIAVYESTPAGRMWPSILRAVSSILAARKRHSSLPELCVELSHRESSLHLKEFSLNSGVRKMLKERNYQGIDVEFPTVCGLIDQVTK